MDAPKSEKLKKNDVCRKTRIEEEKKKKPKKPKDNNAVMGRCNEPPVLFKVTELPASCGKKNKIKNMERRIVVVS